MPVRVTGIVDKIRAEGQNERELRIVPGVYNWGRGRATNWEANSELKARPSYFPPYLLPTLPADLGEATPGRARHVASQHELPQYHRGTHLHSREVAPRVKMHLGSSGWRTSGLQRTETDGWLSSLNYQWSHGTEERNFRRRRFDEANQIQARRVRYALPAWSNSEGFFERRREREEHRWPGRGGLRRLCIAERKFRYRNRAREKVSPDVR